MSRGNFTLKFLLESVLKPAECRIGADFFVRQGDWTQESWRISSPINAVLAEKDVPRRRFDGFKTDSNHNECNMTMTAGRTITSQRRRWVSEFFAEGRQRKRSAQVIPGHSRFGSLLLVDHHLSSLCRSATEYLMYSVVKLPFKEPLIKSSKQ